MHQIVILGGGTGGTLVANRLRRAFPPHEAHVTVVDKDDRHVYQPGLLFVPFGLSRLDDIVRPRSRQLYPGIEFVQDAVDHVDTAGHAVHLASGCALSYDVLVVATGAVLAPEETEGLLGPGWNHAAFTFYEPDSAVALAEALEWFEGGRLVVNVVEMPIKCPVAPLEFCFLADWFFQEQGVRDAIDITYVTPLDGAFTRPVASRRLGRMLDERNIHLVTEFNTGEVVYADPGRGGRLVSYDGREVSFDLAVVIPAHNGALWAARSPDMGDPLGFVPVDEHTLQSNVWPEVFALGDAAAVPISKAGSVTHFEGEVLVENVVRFLGGGRSTPRTTAMPTASSRPGSPRRCSSTSTTTPSRCPATSLERSVCP